MERVGNNAFNGFVQKTHVCKKWKLPRKRISEKKHMYWQTLLTSAAWHVHLHYVVTLVPTSFLACVLTPVLPSSLTRVLVTYGPISSLRCVQRFVLSCILTFLLVCAQPAIFANMCSDIRSDIYPDMSAATYSNNCSGTTSGMVFWHLFWRTFGPFGRLLWQLFGQKSSVLHSADWTPRSGGRSNQVGQVWNMWSMDSGRDSPDICMIVRFCTTNGVLPLRANLW